MLRLMPINAFWYIPLETEYISLGRFGYYGGETHYLDTDKRLTPTYLILKIIWAISNQLLTIPYFLRIRIIGATVN